MAQHFNKLSVFFAQLLGRDQAWPIFLFGLGTVLLPCGQTLIVFSACALEGDPWIGWVNGLAFALLTSPSLFLAMHATRWLCRFKGYYNLGIGLCGAAVGILALARGFAELNWISHWILNPDAEACYHIVLY
jgi:sulfite exporter TauE/SafE